MADDLDPAAVERLLEPALLAAGIIPRSRKGQRIIRAARSLVTPEHDAQVAARALREAAEALPPTAGLTWTWLNTRADRIERQAGWAMSGDLPCRDTATASPSAPDPAHAEVSNRGAHPARAAIAAARGQEES